METSLTYLLYNVFIFEMSTIIRSNDFVKIDIDTASYVYFLKEKSY